MIIPNPKFGVYTDHTILLRTMLVPPYALIDVNLPHDPIV